MTTLILLIFGDERPCHEVENLDVDQFEAGTSYESRQTTCGKTMTSSSKTQTGKTDQIDDTRHHV